METVEAHPLSDTIPPLRIADRCDRCTAQAFVVVQFDVDESTTLMFCGHHYAQHFQAIEARSPFAVRDDRHKINDRSESST